MNQSELNLYLRGISKPLCYQLATDERDRWMKGHDAEKESRGFGEYRTIDHHHLFINYDYVIVARLLNDQILRVPADYDAAWIQREQPNSISGEFQPELWRFRFWINGCDKPFKVDDLDEHDFVTISCGLLNYEHDGRAFISVVDEDGEPISLRIADVMLAEGFDYKNYELETREEGDANA